MMWDYFDDYENAELRQLEARFKSLSETKRLELRKQINSIQIIGEKIAHVELKMHEIEFRVKKIQSAVARELFFLSVGILAFVGFYSLIDFDLLIVKILFPVYVLIIGALLVYFLDDFFSFLGWLNHDKNLEFERSLLWIDFHRQALVKYSPDNSLTILKTPNGRFGFDGENRLIIFMQVMKNIENM